jgi:hemoglobin
MTTLYERAGGEAALRPVLQDFYDRVFADLMIGYLFKGQDKARLVQRELEFTARLLGADVPYAGRPMREAHAPHPILPGHFRRRNKILEETLEAHGVPDEVREVWMRHSRGLEAAIVSPPRRGEECA